MKHLFVGLLSGFLLLAAGCSTPADRIKQNQAAFDQFPPEVKANIQRGQIAVGYTYTMVEMALGKPDHTFSTTTPQGTSETWVYMSNKPHISVGVGTTSYGGGSSTSVGVGMSNDSYGPDERMRVIFVGGVVTMVHVNH